MYYYYYGDYEDAFVFDVHYRFVKEEQHAMNALIQNKCELHFLNIVKEVASTFGIKIIIEALPLEEGGLRKRYRVRPDLQAQPQPQPVIHIHVHIDQPQEQMSKVLRTALLTALLLLPLDIGKDVVKEMITKALNEHADKRELIMDSLTIEKTVLEIQLLKKQLRDTPVIQKNISGFYKQLDKEPDTKSVAVQVIGKDNQILLPEYQIDKEHFKEYEAVRMYTDVNTVRLLKAVAALPTEIGTPLSPMIIKDAVITVISTAFDNGGHKWLGVYGGREIPLSVDVGGLSDVFNEAIDLKKSFQIKATLQIDMQRNRKGNDEVIGYSVSNATICNEKEN